MARQVSVNPLSRNGPPQGPGPVATDRGRPTSQRPQPQNNQLPSPTSSVGGYSRHSDPIDEFFDVSHVNPDAQPLDVDDCLTYMLNFVKTEQLDFIVGHGLSDDDLIRQLRPQAEIAAQLPVKLRYVSPELAMPLAVMGLYDLAVLIDDSASMEFVESGRRKEALMDVLHFLARLYGAVSNDMHGIRAIRFLNGGNHLNADNLKKKDDIEDVIKTHKFKGLTRIGAGLMREILKPFVFVDDPSWVKGTPKKLRQLERPLLIMVITDGAVEGEPEDWVEKAVESVKRSLGAGNVGEKGVVFQFARVGNDKAAEEFLRKLDEESPVSQFVDTLSGGDLMDLIGARAADGNGYQAADLQKMIKLLLGPISDDFDKLADNLIADLADVADDFE